MVWLGDSEANAAYFKWRLIAGTVFVCCVSFVFLIESIMFWAFGRTTLGEVTRVDVMEHQIAVEFDYLDSRGGTAHAEDRISRENAKPDLHQVVPVQYVSLLGTKARLARENNFSMPVLAAFLVSLLATVGLFVWAIRSGDGPAQPVSRIGMARKRR